MKELAVTIKHHIPQTKAMKLAWFFNHKVMAKLTTKKSYHRAKTLNGVIIPWKLQGKTSNLCQAG